MATKTSKPRKSSREAAVPVSYRLQFYTVVAAFSVIAIQTLFLAGSVLASPGIGSSMEYMMPVLASSTVFPIGVFLLAYATSRQYTVSISRWFIAVLKTFIMLGLFGGLQAAWQLFVSTQLFQHGSPHYEQPSAWLTSNIYQYVAMLLTVVAMVIAIKYLKESKKR